MPHICGTVRVNFYDDRPSGVKAQVARWWRFDTTVNRHGEAAEDVGRYVSAAAKPQVGRWCQVATTVTSTTADRGGRFGGAGNFPPASPRECGAADSTEPPSPRANPLVARFRQFAGTVTPMTRGRAEADRGRAVAVLIGGSLRYVGKCQ